MRIDSENRRGWMESSGWLVFLESFIGTLRVGLGEESSYLQVGSVGMETRPATMRMSKRANVRDERLR